MPCMECANGKFKWGSTGECKYESAEACRRANGEGEMEGEGRDVMLLYPHIASRVFNTPLLLDLPSLRAVVDALDRHALPETIRTKSPETVESHSSIARVLDNGVGVLDIIGELVSRSYGLSPSSGLTSYSELSSSLSLLAEDPRVNEIVLNMHTPGGEVGSLFDLADKIYGMRGKKKVTALLNSKATSAGYLLGRAAEKMYIPQDGVTGSIGVVMEHRDISKATEAAGVRYTLLYAGERKVDGHPHGPLSDEAQANIMSKIRYYYDMFVAKAALYSGLSEGKIRATEANTFIGQQAVDQGLVDGMVNVDEFLRNIGTPNSVKSYKLLNANGESKSERSFEMAAEQQKNNDIDTRLAAVEEANKKLLAQLEASEKAREQAEKDAVATKEQLEVISRSLEMKTLNAEIKSRFTLIPGGDGKLAEFLFWARNTSPEQAKFIESTLEMCNELLDRSNLLSPNDLPSASVDVSSTGGSSANQLFRQFEGMVEKYKSEHPGMKEVEVMREVARLNPGMYRKYVSAMRAQTGRIQGQLDS